MELFSQITTLGIVSKRKNGSVRFSEENGDVSARFAIRTRYGQSEWQRYSVTAKGKLAQMLRLQGLSEGMTVLLSGMPTPMEYEIPETGEQRLFFCIEAETVQIMDSLHTLPVQPIQSPLAPPIQPNVQSFVAAPVAMDEEAEKEVRADAAARGRVTVARAEDLPYPVCDE